MRRLQRVTLSFSVLATGVTLPVLFIACGSSSTGAPNTGGADASLADTAIAQPYGASACGSCVAQACATTVQTCEQDPQCTLYVSCIDACATADGGDVSASCAAACPLPNESAGQAAQQAFAACRTESTAACAACGGAPSDDGSADASSDATADASAAEGGAPDGGVRQRPQRMPEARCGRVCGVCPSELLPGDSRLHG